MWYCVKIKSFRKQTFVHPPRKAGEKMAKPSHKGKGGVDSNVADPPIKKVIFYLLS